jgi:hypothetical protein
MIKEWVWCVNRKLRPRASYDLDIVVAAICISNIGHGFKDQQFFTFFLTDEKNLKYKKLKLYDLVIYARST